MNYKIVADSSSNVFSMEGVPYEAVPMKVIAEKEYMDTPNLDLAGMVEDLKQYKFKSGSSCPNVQEWLDAFGDAQWVFGITITKHLSGSYNAAQQAAQTYMEEHPDRKVFIFDSLSAGPELMMIAEKIQQLVEAGENFDSVVAHARDYHNHNHTLFCLKSMMNLARNGRVHPAVAKIAGMLNIRVIGEAQGGQIVVVHKPRGEKKATQAMAELMMQRGLYNGAVVRISHCFAEESANALRDTLLIHFPNCRICIESTTALCSFYAEEGGIIVGFEGNLNTVNSNELF